MTSGKRIGNAEEYGGLYYFKEVNTKDRQALEASCESSSKTKQQGIMLWHFRSKGSNAYREYTKQPQGQKHKNRTTSPALREPLTTPRSLKAKKTPLPYTPWPNSTNYIQKNS
ncbi:hypothetical protein CK203_040929 [Vitis vinifera]|uniref:Uncharacterized protein n=1 Tax=Vitis vinifera TaxID=29760 RepID=A0A438HV94_VITVI|nr:hypothetical protein CK203_040929 [Vitis vinifera]